MNAVDTLVQLTADKHQGSFMDSQLYSVDLYMLILMPVLHCLNYYNFVENLKLGVFLLYFQDFLAILGPFI